MATKAEAYRARAEREAHPPRAPKPRRKKGKLDTTHTGIRNVSLKSKGAKLEDSANGKPSRKSSRASADKTKRTTNLQLRESRKLNAPSSRARAKSR
jgi:hypothetical protein